MAFFKTNPSKEVAILCFCRCTTNYCYLNKLWCKNIQTWFLELKTDLAPWSSWWLAFHKDCTCSCGDQHRMAQSEDCLSQDYILSFSCSQSLFHSKWRSGSSRSYLHLCPHLHERLRLIIWNCTCDPRFMHPKSKIQSFLLLEHFNCLI